MFIKFAKIIPGLSKIYPNWDFWFENKPSGNPVDSPFKRELWQNKSLAAIIDVREYLKRLRSLCTYLHSAIIGIY
jgi:hypothetical protein